MVKRRLLKTPYIEIIVMVSMAVISYGCLGALSITSQPTAPGDISGSNTIIILLAFFLLSLMIAMLSVIAGIGGGVIFTPIMLSFTNVNSIIVRATGLIVAMCSGPVSTGIFIRKGLCNYRLCLVMTLLQGLGALVGASFAVSAARDSGITGEGLIRISLGIILILISIYFFIGGKKSEWPIITKIDRITAMMQLDSKFYEESDSRVREYRVMRAPLGMFLIFFVGLIGGFFGMGGGWAITPILNIGMGIPLKLAAANSGVILGIGSCVSIWPYIYAGGIIPLFVLPWLSGQVIGGVVGSYALAKLNVSIVRILLIGIMFFTSFGLITKGMTLVNLIGEVPDIVHVVLFLIILIIVIASVQIRKVRQVRINDENGK